MQGVRTVELVWQNLSKIALPHLSRPAVKPSEPPTEELVFWGITMYVYSVIAHIQRVLAGLVQLAQIENIAGSFIVSRHVFEWAAHACYMSKHIAGHATDKDWEEAWDLLTVASTGSLWMNIHGSKYAGNSLLRPPVALPKPLRISEAIAEYESYQSKRLGIQEAKDNYSLLSEHCHPNAACLMLYQHYDSDGTVRFTDPEPTSPLTFVNWCLIDLITFLVALLGLARESTIRPNVTSVLTELARRAPAPR
jgi:hypothetical protein